MLRFRIILMRILMTEETNKFQIRIIIMTITASKEAFETNDNIYIFYYFSRSQNRSRIRLGASEVRKQDLKRRDSATLPKTLQSPWREWCWPSQSSQLARCRWAWRALCGCGPACCCLSSHRWAGWATPRPPAHARMIWYLYLIF